MAAITPQEIVLTGLEATYEAATAAGDTFVNDGRTFYHIKNGGGAPITATFDSPEECDQGESHDVAVVVTNAEERMVGPFSPGRFNASGLVTVTLTADTTVTVAALKLST